MTFTVHPTPGTEVKSEEFAEHLKKILAMLDRVHTGFDFLSPTGLNASLGEGKAYIAGYEVGESGDGSEPISFASSTSNQGVYLDEDGNVTVDTVAPAGVASIKLWEVDTDATTITDFRDVRSYTSAFEAAFQAHSLTAVGADPFIYGFRLTLEGLEPYFDLSDTTGGSETITRIRAENGQLNLYDVDTGTLAETLIVNLRDLGSLPFIPLSEKGVANGVATLGAGGLIPTSQLPDATSSVKGAVILSNAAPPSVGTANVQGISTRVARQDHTHAHGNDNATGGTRHAFGQISGVITDAQHGNRAGGSLHPNATSGTAGFMSASDKAKLDAATSSPTPSTVILRDAAGRAQVVAPSSSADIARKDTVDAVQSNLTAHIGDSGDPHAAAQYILADGTRAFLAAQSMGGFRLTNVGTPSASTDAARKADTDALSSSKVSKTGDTMTGALNMDAPITFDDDNSYDVGSAVKRVKKGYFAEMQTGDLLMNDPRCALTGRLIHKGDSVGLQVIGVEPSERDGSNVLRLVPFIIQRRSLFQRFLDLFR